MEGRELDPYEQQLLAVFESCDQDQSGSLDGHGLEQLCEKLQLEEQGFQLMKCLLGNTASNKRVTFPEFRDGLLALLGEDQGERPERREIGDRGSPEREVSPKFVFGKKKYGRRSRPESTEQDLTLEQDENLEDSDLEIFVPVEDKTKEITMRSVPVASSIEDEVTKKRKTGNSPTDRKASSLPSAQNSEMSQVNFPSWQTSAVCSDSATPSLGENEEECLRAAWERLGVGKDGFLDRGELALVCECIGMEKVAEEVVQQLFEKLDVDRDGRISFEEFLLLFRSGGSWVQSSAASQSRTGGKTAAGRIGSNFQQHSEKNKERQALGSSSDQDSQFLSLDPNNAGFVNAELIVEIWEAAGIPGPSRLLQDLGYNESQRLNIADLAAILEEELRSLAEERRNEDAAGARVHSYSPHETLLQATLALYQTEVRCLKLSLEHMSGERDKLRADIMDANQRASLLAQEIDDHHARLEKSSQLQVKLLEQRHAEQLKDLSEQLGSDREQLASQNLSLEKQVESLQEEESRLRTQVSTLQTENEVLEKENQNLTEQLSKSEESKVQLQQELESLAGLQQRLSELEGSHEQEQVLPLLEKLNELQAENTGLRDRNDELTMEVEALSAKLASLKTKKSPVIQPSYDLVDAGASEGSGVPSGGSATKRRGNSPLVLTTEDSSEEESPRLGKMRRCCDGGSGDSQDLSLEAVNMEGLQIHPLGHGESGVETDLEIDDFAESSFKGEEKLKNHHCSDWATNEMLPSLSQREEESEVIANLKAHIAKLEQELKLKSEKLVVCETERSRLKENLYKNPHSVAVAEADKPKSAKQLKGQLKQVFDVIRRQARQELLEESGSVSSLQEYFINLNQRTGQSDLPDMTDDGNMSRVTNWSFSTNTSMPSSMNGMIPDPIENAKDVEQLVKHCRDLRSQLDLVKIEIVKILSEKKACSKENCALKIHISDLRNRLPTDDGLKDIRYSLKSSQDDLKLEYSSEVPSLVEDRSTLIECKETEKNDVSQERKLNGDSSAENSVNINVGEESNLVSISTNSNMQSVVTVENSNNNSDNNEEGLCEKTNDRCCEKNSASSVVKHVKDLSDIWKENEEKHIKEMTEMRERCADLENSLELLRQEYEKCEDYWANKLEEERHLYDQEQKFSDEKYAELMSKIREYEEMFGAQEDDRSEDSDRLSTIEERASLEKQFTDLEEEFEEFKMRTEAEQAEKEEELSKLREQISAMEQVNKHTENKLNVAVQVSDLENGSWESDRTFVVELDGARKAIQHERDSLRIGKTPERAAGLLNGYNSMRSKILPGSRSSSPQSGPSTYSDNAELRAELIRLRNLKEQLDEECQVLRQQKEDLVQDVLDIQTGKPHHQNGGVGMPFSFPPHWTAGAKAGGQACRIDLNILQALNARLRQQEQQCRHLQQALKQQQQQSESILKRTWQKHKEEVSTLQSLLQTTQEKLNQQTSACKEQMERLARTDVLVKDLYVENAYLVATVQRLEQHCHVLVQMTSDSSSV
ncbi:ninein homolog isoform X2 [Periplaneta americana]|uniref:ninein homolog isoform X2 n=1 Tax=Periplaneta americana TaxID=6978 RepID=UPI0037E90D5A